MVAKKIYFQIKATQEAQKIREKNVRKYMEDRKHISQLDFQIWTLQVKPLATDIIDTEENLKIYQDTVRAFRSV